MAAMEDEEKKALRLARIQELEKELATELNIKTGAENMVAVYVKSKVWRDAIALIGVYARA